MTASEDRYAVVGNPIAHSLSPQIHSAFAAQCGESMRYERVLAPLDGFAACVDDFARAGGSGLNVTLPFKGDAFDYVDVRDELAAAAGAVNTIVLRPGAPSRGFNTDGIGLLRDLRDRHALQLAGKVVVLLGAGGAAQGVVAPLLQAQPRALVIANRTGAKAEALAAHHRESSGTDVPLVACGLFDELQRALQELKVSADIVINATSSGLQGGADMLAAELVSGAFCYDMSYGDAALFRAWAQRNGAAAVADGLGMLVEQAAESFYIWRGKRPQTTPVVEQLRRQHSLDEDL